MRNKLKRHCAAEVDKLAALHSQPYYALSDKLRSAYWDLIGLGPGYERAWRRYAKAWDKCIKRNAKDICRLTDKHFKNGAH